MGEHEAGWREESEEGLRKEIQGGLLEGKGRRNDIIMILDILYIFHNYATLMV